MLPFPWEASPVLERFSRLAKGAQFLPILEPAFQHQHSHYQLLDGLPALGHVLEDFFQRAGSGGMSLCDAHSDGIGRAPRSHLASRVTGCLRSFTVVRSAVGCRGLQVWLLAVPMRPGAHRRPRLLPYESYLTGAYRPGRPETCRAVHFRVSRAVGIAFARTVTHSFAA